MFFTAPKTKIDRFAIASKVYDILYARAALILKLNNPCRHEIKDGCHSCLGKKDQSHRTKAACCVDCEFWDNGCKAEKPLTCKVWLCPTAGDETSDKIHAALSKIEQYALTFCFYVCRGDRKQSLNRCLQSFERTGDKKFLKLFSTFS